MASIKRNVLWVAMACALLVGLVVAAPADAESPWWSVSPTTRPANLPPGGEGTVVVRALNVGDGTTSGSLTLSDTLPTGVVAQSVRFYAGPVGDVDLSVIPETCETTPSHVQCTYQPELFEKNVIPFEYIELRIAVKVEEGAVSGSSHVTMTGGGAPSASRTQPLLVSGAPTPFGVGDFSFLPEEEGGAVDKRAGSHPFQLTASLALNQTANLAKPPALPKDLTFKLPPGLVGNATAVAQCTQHDFSEIAANGGANLCPEDTVVGVATVNLLTEYPESPELYAVPLFNLVPQSGEPARFGFEVLRSPVTIDTSVRTGRDYGVVASTSNITQLVGFLATQLTFWGVPGDARHDQSRGWGCVAEGARGAGIACVPAGEDNPAPLLTMPTSCTSPLTTSVEGDSWPTKADPAGVPLPRTEFQPESSPGQPVKLTGCDELPFTPSIQVTPETTSASTSTGVNVHVHLPQDTTDNGSGLAESAVKDITVALPEGLAVNPSGANGLSACNEGLVGFTGFSELDQAYEPGTKTATFTPRLPGSIAALEAGESSPLQQAVNFCPDASKIATVKIKTPLLPNMIEGAVYLASQNLNPFGGLIAMYVVAEDPATGVLVKLAGNVHLSETGQLITTFENDPQVPLEDAEFHFFGGERAPLATPSHCGAYTTTSSMTPWSGNPASTPSSTFNITSGPNGSPCPGASLPFSPSLTSGTMNINAGAFSPFTTTIGREDGSQNLQAVQLQLPEGLEGVLAGVKLCDEADANAGTCSPESQIGEATVSAGIGNEPVSVKGAKVFITETYAGAPFGLSIAAPVKAGPLDLEHDAANPNNQPPCDCVVVRAKIEINVLTAALTITTDPSGPHAIPHLIDGIPVQIKKVNVLVNREHFTFNPTNCTPTAITGSITSSEGGVQPLSVPFHAANCGALRFAPKFSVSTSGKTSKAYGASLIASLSEPQGAGTYANITRVKVDLPKQLPSRLTTLQKACTSAQFAANPANCPADSKIGTATVTTPLLPVPLTGPAIFVSHGGEAFPSLTMVLQGDNVTEDLVGATFISKAGITSTTFKTVPDVPFNTFQLTLPEGKFSALAANGDLCQSKLAMPTEFVGQNGAVIHESTKMSVTGCPKTKPATRAQKLTKALKLCRTDNVRGKRATCEKVARKSFGTKKKTKG
jgi:hypothetical protein